MHIITSSCIPLLSCPFHAPGLAQIVPEPQHIRPFAESYLNK